MKKVHNENKTNHTNESNNELPLPANVCPKCRGSEYIFLENGKVTECECKARKEIERRLYSANIPPKFMEKGLESFIPKDKKRKDIITAANTIVSGFKPNPRTEKPGILLRGPVGCGKTHIAVGILRAIIEKGYTGKYANVPDILAKLRNTYNEDTPENELDVINSLVDCDVLVFDDLGAEATSGWVRDRLYLIINALYERNKTLIVTTNCNLDELNKQVGPRITSRICELCNTFPPFPDEDYRRINMK